MNPVESLSEKEVWTTPVLKKLDIEETAFGDGLNADGTDFS
jgi:hypothetical protein